jgi:glycine/D-amino acid oxidase-like deaminating enzyme/nitrite reductase/ring-hydroxylating ferredoxin subunit
MQEPDAAHRGLWHATATPQRYPAMASDQRAGVVVVGAGITGLTTALLLAGKGVDVVVVEALDVAAGVTGRTTAKVTSQHSMLYSTIASKHGEDGARVYGEANQAAVEQVASLVQQGAIECSLERRPALVYTQDADTVATIEEEAELCRRLGLPSSFVPSVGDDLPYDIRGAMRFDDQLQLQPVAYCDGLARMLVAAGGRIFEQTRVTNLDMGTPVTVETERGAITADAVVLATHIPIVDRGLFSAKADPHASHAVALETDGPVPQGMYITADSPSRSVRSFTHDGRSYLVVVGEGHRTGEEDAEAHEQALIDWAAQHWPDARVAYTWMAEDYSPLDAVPYIGRLASAETDVFVATGFQKWGLSNGTAAAMILSETVLGHDHPWADVFDARRITPIASAKTFVEHNLKSAAHMVGDRFAQRSEEIAALQPGDGAILSIDGSNYAVSKDDDGRVTALSPKCTHMGCLVAYNGAERTWDCPCHGSRFACDGTVIHGPATTPLAPQDLPAADGA